MYSMQFLDRPQERAEALFGWPIHIVAKEGSANAMRLAVKAKATAFVGILRAEFRISHKDLLCMAS